MDLFKNIYIIILSLVMPFIVDLKEPFGALSIGYGVLALIYFIYTRTRKDPMEDTIVRLQKKLDEIDDYLDQGKGIIEVAQMFQEQEGIPPVLTLKSVLYTIHEACKEDVLPYTHALDRKAPADVGVMKLLKQMLVDFPQKESFDLTQTIRELDEFENVLYVKENVTFKIKRENEEIQKGFGVLILTVHEVLFIPMKWEFLKNIDRGKLFDLLHQASSSMPFLNVGLATSELLLAYKDAQKPAEIYFNDERKAEMQTHYEKNKGWNIPYHSIEEMVFPYKMRGLKGVDHSVYIKTDQYSFQLYQIDDMENFKIELLEQLLVGTLMYENIYYPINEKYDGHFHKCDLVPHSEIDYDDPRMVEFREKEMKSL